MAGRVTVEQIALDWYVARRYVLGSAEAGRPTCNSLQQGVMAGMSQVARLWKLGSVAGASVKQIESSYITSPVARSATTAGADT